MYLRSNIKSICRFALLTFSLVLCTNSFAAEGGRSGKKHGPPAEAVDACAGLAVDQACEFASRNGDALTGLCSTPPRGGDTLACKPENHERRERPDKDDQTES